MTNEPINQCYIQAGRNISVYKLTSHLVTVSNGYILNVRFVLGSSIRIPSKPTCEFIKQQPIKINQESRPTVISAKNQKS